MVVDTRKAWSHWALGPSAGVAMLGAAGVASAQPLIPEFVFGGSVSARANIGEFTDFGAFDVVDGDVDPNFNIVGAAHFGLELPLGLGAFVDIGYGGLTIDDGIQTSGGPLELELESPLLTTFVNGQWRLPFTPIISPYVEVGVGYGFLVDIDDTPGALGVRGGAGVDIAVTPVSSVFVEASYARFFDFEADFTNGLSTEEAQFDLDTIEVGAGMMFRF